MLPDPLHPLIVHFPIVLVVLLPVVAVIALWMIRRGAAPKRAWSVPLVVAGALALSSWLAVQTGEREEDRVETVVSEAPIESHEEAAETFLLLSGAMVLLAAGGLAPGRAGQAVRLVATVGTVLLVGAGVQVGRTGGDLVYRHGAASAYTTPRANGASADVARAVGSDDDASSTRRRGDRRTR
jgi:uncharacterized membrane protein